MASRTIALALAVVAIGCTTSSTGGNVGDGGIHTTTGPESDANASDTGQGSACDDHGIVSHPECSTIDLSNVPTVDCKLVTAPLPDTTGGTFPSDGTYVLTDCSDYPTDAGPPAPPGTQRLTYRWKFIFKSSGTKWDGMYTS